VALKKPSDYFTRKETSSVNNVVQDSVKELELDTFSDAFDSFKKNLSKIETLSEFSESLDSYHLNVERVNYLSKKIEDIQIEIKSLLKKEDLDRAMMSQLILVEQTIADVQDKVKSINQKNLSEIRSDVKELTEAVNEFIEVEVPKYKRSIIDVEFRSNTRYENLENNVNQTLEDIGNTVDSKYQELTETLQGINEKTLVDILEEFETLEETVFEFKNKVIPKHKKLIIDTEIKTESKINKFEEKLNETISSILYKINLIEGDKTDIINIVDQKINEIVDIKDVVVRDIEKNYDIKEELTKKITNLEVEIIRNESHIRVQNKNFKHLQENIRSEIKKLNLDELEQKNHKLSEKIKYLEEIFKKFNEKEILTENIITEPPKTKNKDPLTPLDQNFVTLDQLQEHYRTFLNRIQQQLSTLGGGGETRLKYLDDIVGIATNSAAYDGKVLSYNHSIGKFEFITGGGSGNAAITISDTPPLDPEPGNLWYDNTIGRTFIYYEDEDGAQWVDASPSGLFGNWIYTDTETTTQTNVGIGTATLSLPSSKLEVFGGDVRVGVNTSEGLVMTSPNGTTYRLIVNDDGTLTTASL
jgi:hypothetical protein